MDIIVYRTPLQDIHWQIPAADCIIRQTSQQATASIISNYVKNAYPNYFSETSLETCFGKYLGFPSEKSGATWISRTGKTENPRGGPPINVFGLNPATFVQAELDAGVKKMKEYEESRTQSSHVIPESTQSTRKRTPVKSYIDPEPSESD